MIWSGRRSEVARARDAGYRVGRRVESTVRVALRQGRPASAPRPAKLPPPPDVARTWSVAGLAGLPLVLIVLSCRGTPVAQPAALFGVGLPLVCVMGAFVQRHRGLLVGSYAHQFTWIVRLGGLLFLLGVVGAMWRSQARALLATLTGGTGTTTGVAMEPVLAGLANGILIVAAWRVGRRLYARTGLLDIQPWERGDEGMRLGRLRLVEGLWRDLLVGSVIEAVALGAMWARAAMQLDHIAVTLLTLVALPLYLGGGVTLMSSLTGVARRSGWALEGLVVGERLPSPWSATTLRVALGGAGALAVLTASPLLGLLHADLFWLESVMHFGS